MDSESCDDMSLPSVPSYFDIEDSADIADIGDVITNDNDVSADDGDVTYDVITPRAGRDSGAETSFGSCDTVILNTAAGVQRYLMSSKPTQTLALPFRLVKYLPNESVTRIYHHQETVELLPGNTVGVQVDMTTGYDCSLEDVREMSWRNNETGNQVDFIQRKIVC